MTAEAGMDRESVALFAGIASAMAADAHHSTQMIEQSYSHKIVEMYDGMKQVLHDLGSALESGNMFRLVEAHDNLSELVHLSSIGIKFHRESPERWDA